MHYERTIINNMLIDILDSSPGHHRHVRRGPFCFAGAPENIRGSGLRWSPDAPRVPPSFKDEHGEHGGDA